MLKSKYDPDSKSAGLYWGDVLAEAKTLDTLNGEEFTTKKAKWTLNFAQSLEDENYDPIFRAHVERELKDTFGYE